MPKINRESSCVACLGIGKNTKGNVCPICNGSGERRKYDAQNMETRVTPTSQHTKASPSSKSSKHNGK